MCPEFLGIQCKCLHRFLNAVAMPNKIYQPVAEPLTLLGLLAVSLFVGVFNKGIYLNQSPIACRGKRMSVNHSEEDIIQIWVSVTSQEIE